VIAHAPSFSAKVVLLLLSASALAFSEAVAALIAITTAAASDHGAAFFFPPFNLPPLYLSLSVSLSISLSLSLCFYLSLSLSITVCQMGRNSAWSRWIGLQPPPDERNAHVPSSLLTHWHTPRHKTYIFFLHILQFQNT
jgi:hypothetical protein